MAHAAERTISQQRLVTEPKHLSQLPDGFASTLRAPDEIPAFVIGHVPMDGDSARNAGAAVGRMIHTAPNDGLVHAVLRGTRLKLGWAYWRDAFADRVDVLQLNLREAQQLSANGEKPTHIGETLEVLRKQAAPAVLTTDQFGRRPLAAVDRLDGR